MEKERLRNGGVHRAGFGLSLFRSDKTGGVLDNAVAFIIPREMPFARQTRFFPRVRMIAETKARCRSFISSRVERRFDRDSERDRDNRLLEKPLGCRLNSSGPFKKVRPPRKGTSACYRLTENYNERTELSYAKLLYPLLDRKARFYARILSPVRILGA